MTVLRSGYSSDTGLVRSSNQDRVLVGTSLFAVADGMGGHAGGEVAARLAVDTLEAAFNRSPTGNGLLEAVRAANAVVWGQSLEHLELRGMGTTLTAIALVEEDGRDLLVLANVGDSRAYRLRNGTIAQISEDHSLAEEMVRTGELTSAEAAVHPHRHILTRALGVSTDVDVDLWRVVPMRGDRFLLCSDGLSNELGNNQIAEVLSSVPDPQDAADLLVDAAKAHGGSDNVTTVVVDVVIGERQPDEVASKVVQPSAVVGNEATHGAPLPVPEAGTRSGNDEATGEAGTAQRPLGRSERRLERRRARRQARTRRLVTVRTFLFAVLVVAVLAGAFTAVRWFDANSYFVGLDGSELVIYQGRIGGLLWYHPVVVERTGVTTADVDPTYLPVLRSGVEESSVTTARTYVQNLVASQPTTQALTLLLSSATLTPATVAPGTTSVVASAGSAGRY